MNADQYNNWKTLSLGLGAHGYPTLTPARRAKLLAAIEDCLQEVACEGLDRVGTWDSGVRIDERCWSESVSSLVNDYLDAHRYAVGEPGGVRRGRFGTMLMACVRAGFDVAVAPSGGVVGFTVGDLRRIFDGALPDWVAGWFSPALAPSVPSEAGVWL